MTVQVMKAKKDEPKLDEDYHKKVWRNVEEQLIDRGYQVSFEVLSSGLSPFSVVVRGEDAQEIVDLEFREDLCDTIRRAVACFAKTEEEKHKILNRHGWPVFEIKTDSLTDEELGNEIKRLKKGIGPVTVSTDMSTDEIIDRIKGNGSFVHKAKSIDSTTPLANSPSDVHCPDPDRLKDTSIQLGSLLAEKNIKYGNSFHTAEAALNLLYPYGIKPEQYKDALFLARIWDKMKRIATDRDAFGESPYQDIAGYALLGLERVNYEKQSLNGATIALQAAKAAKEYKGAKDV